VDNGKDYFLRLMEPGSYASERC